MRRDQDIDSPSNEDNKGASMFGSDEEVGTQIPTQAQSVVEGSGAVLVSEFRPVADVDYLQVCLLINLAFFSLLWWMFGVGVGSFV